MIIRHSGLPVHTLQAGLNFYQYFGFLYSEPVTEELIVAGRKKTGQLMKLKAKDGSGMIEIFQPDVVPRHLALTVDAETWKEIIRIPAIVERETDLIAMRYIRDPFGNFLEIVRDKTQ